MATIRPLIAILNGGTSRRFGRDKSLVTLDGVTLLERLVATARQVSPDVVIAGRRPDAPTSAEILEDPITGEGPLTGVRRAFSRAGSRPLIVLPCDLPLLTAAHLEVLAAPLAPFEDGRVPVVAGVLSPIPACYAPSAAAAFDAVANSGRRALRLALPQLRLTTLTEADLASRGLDPRGLIDFDTPDELAALQGPRTDHDGGGPHG